MKFKKVITELQAEIVKGKIPGNKIFSTNGNITQLGRNDEWRKVLGEILVAIEGAGLSNDFASDREPVDIIGKNLSNGKVVLQSDSGIKYFYDINKKLLLDASGAVIYPKKKKRF